MESNNPFGIINKWSCSRCGTENLSDVNTCRVCSASSKEKKEITTRYNKAENTLITIADVVLWVGIIGSIIMLITAIVYFNDDYYMTEHRSKDIGVSLLIYTAAVSSSSIILWALLKVISNVSLTLKDINQKIK